jgi:hypothetical protein
MAETDSWNLLKPVTIQDLRDMIGDKKSSGNEITRWDFF